VVRREKTGDGTMTISASQNRIHPTNLFLRRTRGHLSTSTIVTSPSESTASLRTKTINDDDDSGNDNIHNDGGEGNRWHGRHRIWQSCYLRLNRHFRKVMDHQYTAKVGTVYLLIVGIILWSNINYIQTTLLRGIRPGRRSGRGSSGLLLPIRMSPGSIVKPQTVVKRIFKYPHPDFGGLLFGSLSLVSEEEGDYRRTIGTHDREQYEKHRKKFLSVIDKGGTDKDTDHDIELRQNVKCRRNNWVSSIYTVCNNFHELGTERLQANSSNLYYNDIAYLGHGYYRDAWLLKSRHVKGDVPLVMKQLRIPFDDKDDDHNLNAWSLLKVQREAIIMERLTSSPRYDMFYVDMLTNTIYTSTISLSHHGI
jgi:hypothetical protein